MGDLSVSASKMYAKLSCIGSFVAEAAMLKLECLPGDLRPFQDSKDFICTTCVGVSSIHSWECIYSNIDCVSHMFNIGAELED